MDEAFFAGIVFNIVLAFAGFVSGILLLTYLSFALSAILLLILLFGTG